MRNLPSIGALSLLGALLAGPAPAQQTPPDKAPATTDQQAATPAPEKATPEQPPAPSASAVAEQPPPAIIGPMSTGDAHLVVATVTLKEGWRASKLIGSSVYNDQNQKIGSIDDLILTHDNKVAMAVISVGGFLGIGSKLVAVPSSQLQVETTKDNSQKVLMRDGSKEALNAMPTFTYGNT